VEIPLFDKIHSTKSIIEEAAVTVEGGTTSTIDIFSSFPDNSEKIQKES
jgi:hypothetical protein